jgi:hypothetical protein
LSVTPVCALKIENEFAPSMVMDCPLPSIGQVDCDGGKGAAKRDRAADAEVDSIAG